MKHPLEILLDLLACASARASRERLYATGRKLGWLHAHGIRHRRAYVLATLARCFPEKTPAEHRRIATLMYRHLSFNMLELLRLAGGGKKEFEALLDIQGEEHLRAALERRRGVLVLTAHLGNWDLMGILAAVRGYPLTIISKRIKNRGINAFWMRLREDLGVGILPPRQSYRDCLRVLRRNELLGFILDVNRRWKTGIFVDFFSRPACTSPGLAYLSAQSGAPVVPVFTRRLPDGRHRIEVLPAMEPPPGRDPEQILAATQAYTLCIEDAVRRCPEQWLWLHKRWRTQPLPEHGDQAN